MDHASISGQLSVDSIALLSENSEVFKTILPLFTILHLTQGIAMTTVNLRSKTVLTTDGPWNKYSWSPTSEEQELTLNLASEYLKSHQKSIFDKLSQYHVQLVGYDAPAEKKVHLNFYCDEEKSTGYLFTFDGGDCYFRINVDLKNKMVLKFDVNGEA